MGHPFTSNLPLNIKIELIYSHSQAILGTAYDCRLLVDDIKGPVCDFWQIY